MQASISGGLQPRIRHISSIHIRNFTPFPARDAVASALTQPAERPQFNLHGQLSDDADITLSRRRSRKISLNSINSVHTLRSDAGVDVPSVSGTVGEPRGRKGKSIEVGLPAGSTSISVGVDSVSPSRHHKTASGSVPTIRPRRPRTTSHVSASSISFDNGPGPISTQSITSISATSSTGLLSAMLPDNSQTGLENVIQSRLVETFITITVPPHEVETARIASTSRPVTPLDYPSMKEKAHLIPKQGKLPNGVGAKKELMNGKVASPTRTRGTSASPSPKKPAFPHSTIHTNRNVSSSSHKLSASVADRLPGGNSPAPTSPVAVVPNYLSAIHRPSTNPVFYTDQFTDWTDTSANKLKIQIWAKVGENIPKKSTLSRKGKEKQTDENDVDPEWKVLQEWDINLNDLVPLPSDLRENSELLPSNTLVFFLSPPGQYFYISPPTAQRERSSSPSAGYNSDPELEVRKSKQATESLTHDSQTSPYPSEIIALSRRRHRKVTGQAHDCQDELAKTASWQDLFKLVSLQSCVVDTETSLNDVISSIEKTVDTTETILRLKREVSEREAWVDGLRANCDLLKKRSDELRNQIHARRKALGERRSILNTAIEQLKDDMRTYSDVAMEVTEEEHRLQSLRAQLQPIRTSHISTLSSIYPIELLSPPDLLYTILDVPLPIPLTSTDPAPPLSLPHHKDINEDVVATSLGYAAQVVQLLAAYLGKGLVYPVTCIGSRSLVRDGISAMVGPRMFPLFSRGVDTYRFEYGVFLLNKDIEMLMVDRDLRPVDMRHTLPNLKNLLLTLTSGEDTFVRTIHRPPSSVLSISSLESPRPQSPETPDTDVTTTPKASKATELPAENTTPPASGTTTPTVSTPLDTQKKGQSYRPYLSLAPLSSFLRSHLPSATVSKPTAKEVFEGESQRQAEENRRADGHPTPPAEQVHSGSSGDHDDEGGVDNGQLVDDEDRRTIRGVPAGLGIDQDLDGGSIKGEEWPNRDVDTESNEKTKDLVPSTAPPTAQPPVSPIS